MTTAEPKGHDPAPLPMPPPPPPFEPDPSLITQLEKGVRSAETKSGT
ncbi:MAG: hypothetical protein LC721_04755 [Actinobacteria bacterium]|nr:hypothetical protein [Actinomycetota bacterium]